MLAFASDLAKPALPKMEQEIKKDIVVFYHGVCRDGLTAAWAAWKKFGDMAEYIPIVWTNTLDLIPIVKNKEIYFLDYCPVQEKVDEMVKENKSVTVVDHHVSRESVIKTLTGSVYDITHSGAVLAWKFFHPDKPVPQLCLYVEDSDIWNWKISDSAKVLDYIDFKYNADIKTWDQLAADLEKEENRKDFALAGSVLLEYRDKLADLFIKEHALLVNFEGYEVFAINGPRNFRSVIGTKLAQQRPHLVLFGTIHRLISLFL